MGKHTKYYFSSLSAMAKHIADNAEQLVIRKNGYGTPTDDNRVSFTGGTYSDCIDKMLNGDSELLSKFVKAQGHVNIVHNTETTMHDVRGSFVDIGAFVGGSPECMIDFVTEDNTQFCEIVLNTAYSSKTSHDRMFEKYIYVVKLIDILESNNTRCKVVVANYAQGHKATKKPTYDGNKCEITVLLKDYKEQLSLSHLLFACCNPLFLRMAILCLFHIELEKIGFPYAGCCSGYETKPTCDIYIDSMYNDYWQYQGTQEDFENWSKRYINR